MKPTIHDVAKRAGVSIKTVSRVINKEPNVRDETREKVAKAVAALGYRPDPSARRLAGNRSFLMGLLYDNPSASYVINIQTGVLKVCQQEGYDLLIHPCDYQAPGLAAEIAAFSAHSKLDGLILTPPLSDLAPVVRAIREQGIPFTQIAPADPGLAASVSTNDREACREMTRHLVSLGHSRIGFIIGHPDHRAVLTRYSGYRDAMQECGKKLDDRLVVQGYNSFESGIECARKLLRLRKPPSAIVASNDDMAAGVMLVAHEKGLEIPGDLSVAGFDDIPLARQLWPALTTVRQPMETMAGLAAELLIAQLRGDRPDHGAHVIESTLMIRQSTGPARGGRD